jgi:predicted RND superfamily exporter protein
VFLYVAFHMGSLFLAASCMLQVVVSIPISLFIFKVVLGIGYLSILHLFVVIMIIGIGADDIFVFHDFWTHTKHIKAIKNRPPLRLAYTLRKAAYAMLTTSATTAVSFLSTCINPIMPVVSFGLFASLVVTLNYIMLIVVVPSIYICYEVDVEPRTRWMNCCKKNKENEEREMDVVDIVDLTPLSRSPEVSLRDFSHRKHGIIQKFFDKVLAPFSFRYRKPIIVTGIIWLLFTLVLAANMGKSIIDGDAILGNHATVAKGASILKHVIYHADEEKIELNWGTLPGIYDLD